MLVVYEFTYMRGRSDLLHFKRMSAALMLGSVSKTRRWAYERSGSAAGWSATVVWKAQLCW